METAKDCNGCCNKQDLSWLKILHAKKQTQSCLVCNTVELLLNREESLVPRRATQPALQPILGGILLLAGMARSWPQPFAQGRRELPPAADPALRPHPAPCVGQHSHHLSASPLPTSPSNAFAQECCQSPRKELTRSSSFIAFSERLTSSHLLRAGKGCVPSNSVCGTSLTRLYRSAVMVGEGEIQKTSLQRCRWG